MNIKLNALDWIAFVLLIIGGLNWALIGFFNFDLVSYLLGTFTMSARVVYVVVGLSALYVLFTLPNLKKIS